MPLLPQVLVLPPYQGRGLGKKLLTLAYDIARSKGVQDLTVGAGGVQDRAVGAGGAGPDGRSRGGRGYIILERSAL